MQEQLEKDAVEWAITDKKDAKFNKKLEEKMTDKGPSKKEI